MTSDSAHTWFRRGLEALSEESSRPTTPLVAAAFRAADRLVASSPEARDRQCGAGCTACCHFTVGITAAEALHLHAVVAAHPRRDALHQRLAHRVESLPTTGDAPNHARSACVLLGADGRCEIYEDRPLACRGWNSTDRLGCELEHRGLGGTPRPDGAAYHAVLGVSQALEDRGRELLAADSPAADSPAADSPVADSPAADSPVADSPASGDLGGHFVLHDALHRLAGADGAPQALRGARRPLAAQAAAESSA